MPNEEEIALAVITASNGGVAIFAPWAVGAKTWKSVNTIAFVPAKGVISGNVAALPDPGGNAGRCVIAMTGTLTITVHFLD